MIKLPFRSGERLELLRWVNGTRNRIKWGTLLWVPRSRLSDAAWQRIEETVNRRRGSDACFDIRSALRSAGE